MTTINQRIRYIRKQTKLKQEDFGAPINLKRSTVSDLEKDNHPVTDKNITLLCKEYNLNENWLRTGNGEIYNTSNLFSLDAYAKRYNISEKEKDLIRKFMQLNDDMKKSFINYIESAFGIRQTALKEVAEKNAEKKSIKNKSTLTKKQSSKEEQLEIKLVARGAATLVGTRAEIIKALEEDLDRDDNDDYDAY